MADRHTPQRISGLIRDLLNYAATDQVIPSPRQTYEGAVGAKYPAHQVRGIWHYYPDDVPVIAAAYGLTPKTEPRPCKASDASVAA